jgi:hypothetical protein
MKKLTVPGDGESPLMSDDASSPIPLEQWPEALTRNAHRFETNPLYFGHAVRTDAWSCSDAARPWHTLYLVLEGEIATRVAAESFVLKPGTLFWLMPHEPHDMQWPTKLVFTEIWFRLRDNAHDICLPEPVMVQEGAWDILPFMDGIEDEMRRHSVGYEQKIRHWLALIVLDSLRSGGVKGGNATTEYSAACASDRVCASEFSGTSLTRSNGRSRPFVSRLFLTFVPQYLRIGTPRLDGARTYPCCRTLAARQ